MREALRQFAEYQERILCTHDHTKVPWVICENSYLLQRLKEEVIELEEALINGNTDHIRHEAADVGNFAMMIFDNTFVQRNKDKSRK